jgi:hypothetical protein
VQFCVTVTGARILFFAHPHAVATMHAAATTGATSTHASFSRTTYATAPHGDLTNNPPRLS